MNHTRSYPKCILVKQEMQHGCGGASEKFMLIHNHLDLFNHSCSSQVNKVPCLLFCSTVGSSCWLPFLLHHLDEQLQFHLGSALHLAFLNKGRILLNTSVVLPHIITNSFVMVATHCLEVHDVNWKTIGNTMYYFTGTASFPGNKTCFILPSRCLSYTSPRKDNNQWCLFLKAKFSSDG